MTSKILIHKHESDIDINFALQNWASPDSHNFINDNFFIFIDTFPPLKLNIKYEQVLIPLTNTFDDIYIRNSLQFKLLPMDEDKNIYIILNRVSKEVFNNFISKLSKYQKLTNFNVFIIYINENYYYENIIIKSSDIFSQIVLVCDDYINIKQKYISV